MHEQLLWKPVAPFLLDWHTPSLPYTSSDPSIVQHLPLSGCVTSAIQLSDRVSPYLCYFFSLIKNLWFQQVLLFQVISSLSPGHSVRTLRVTPSVQISVRSSPPLLMSTTPAVVMPLESNGSLTPVLFWGSSTHDELTVAFAKLPRKIQSDLTFSVWFRK